MKNARSNMQHVWFCFSDVLLVLVTGVLFLCTAAGNPLWDEPDRAQSLQGRLENLEGRIVRMDKDVRDAARALEAARALAEDHTTSRPETQLLKGQER